MGSEGLTGGGRCKSVMLRREVSVLWGIYENAAIKSKCWEVSL